ncbi:hypothetical protein JWS13_02935 (plasmid) [Rhodococcus pseudokoreensis]|uniref:Tryptophan-associated transmembrane protein (Trp_oprn_chp) n=1 Tax=Rhodococcus pseudokoreensis TaxID=2811421 RepID=A0A974VXU6_9NOCA|nr:hypothetical protein [Rhodococcus pseudokoreensis]QSE87630.1 hypothetical protein JWS13_02935 [Rhodococcus pseudokoreensis]
MNDPGDAETPPSPDHPNRDDAAAAPGRSGFLSSTDPSAAQVTAAEAERKMASEINPGARAMVVAAAVLVLLLSFSLPHSGVANGWDVLVSSDNAGAEAIALPSRIFVTLAVAFGAVMSMLALVTRMWVVAWAALAGCALGSVFGMLAVWSRQTVSPNLDVAGVGPGLLLGWVTVIFLTFHWLKVVWGRTVAQMDAEQERRRLTAEAEQRGDLPPGSGAFRPKLK